MDPRRLEARLLALLCLQGAIATVVCIQRFDEQPQYTEVNPNEDALLACKVLNKKGMCYWQKDNKPVGIYPKKYEWAGGQETADCSLWVRSATIDFDDGEWECQVTASDFMTQDALTSTPARLVVRVAPQRPRIEYNASQILPDHNVTAQVGDKSTVKCVSRYGNPPAKLKWFLGEMDLTAGTNQTNGSELDNRRTWVATSVLALSFSKEHHGKTLRCVALHESYDTKSQAISVRLDVRYPPETRLQGAPAGDVEEGQDDVVLRCAADANPPATVLWRRAGRSDVVSLQETLQLRPASRRDSGTYSCVARNLVGSSDPLSVHIDVKYPPQIVSVGPDRLVTAPLFSQVTFTCSAEGNPKPSYQWLQKTSAPDAAVLLRGTERKLHVANVTYDYQGEYVCKAANVIGGRDREAQSETIAVQVVGAPQVLRLAEAREVVVSRGQDALLSLVVCADPRPRHASWEWGSLKLEAGADLGRYRADQLAQDRREDCYEARLHVASADTADARNYYLAVENDKGEDRHAVHLAVTEPVSTATMLGLAVGSLLVLLTAICVVVYSVRREKCCFARTGDFRPTDLESEKSELDGRKTPRLEPPSLGGPGGAIPAEAVYTTSPTRRPQQPFASSPEAMKRRVGHGAYKPTTDNVYADLQLENSGSIVKKNNAAQQNFHRKPSDTTCLESPRETSEYLAAGRFQPNSFEQAEI